MIQSTSRDDIILEHVALVNLMVKDFLTYNPQFRTISADLRSNAMISLIRTVDKFLDENKDFDNYFRNYLRRSIKNGCWDVVRTENVIQKPRVHKATRRPFFEDDGAEVENPPSEILDEGSFREFSSLQAMRKACSDETDHKIFDLAAKGIRGLELTRVVGITARETKERIGHLLQGFREIY